MENSSEIKVSVIIPVYNTSQYLERCLNSVVKQTLKEIEIICVNDGSTDNSLDILKAYSEKDGRIVLINQENHGQAHARNQALKIAGGEYIGFVDSDDWIDLDYYEKLYNTAKNHDAEIAICSLKRIYQVTQKFRLNVETEQEFTEVNKKFEFAKIPNQCYPVNKIFKTDKLREFGLTFPEGRFFEDVVFTPKAVCYLGKMVSVPKVTYWYWGNRKSTVKAKNQKKIKDLIMARDELRAFAHEHGIILKKKDSVMRKYQYNLLGIPVLKIYEWEHLRKYYLFGFIKIMERQIYL
ncbi:glycosyltransferase family 2 protein [bacterium]|nr:glycosyltransferase family 2 protein [bacterium]